MGAENVYYTDGSADGTRKQATKETRAGWGVVEVQSNRLTAELFGKVITDLTHKDYMGAEKGSNNTAEITAIMQALRRAAAIPGSSTIEIRYDSTYAKKMTTGEWEAKTNKLLISAAQELLRTVEKQHIVRFRHVKGHSGEWWNERADRLADVGRGMGNRSLEQIRREAEQAEQAEPEEVQETPKAFKIKMARLIPVRKPRASAAPQPPRPGNRPRAEMTEKQKQTADRKDARKRAKKAQRVQEVATEERREVAKKAAIARSKFQQTEEEKLASDKAKQLLKVHNIKPSKKKGEGWQEQVQRLQREMRGQRGMDSIFSATQNPKAPSSQEGRRREATSEIQTRPTQPKKAAKKVGKSQQTMQQYIGRSERNEKVAEEEGSGRERVLDIEWLPDEMLEGFIRENLPEPELGLKWRQTREKDTGRIVWREMRQDERLSGAAEARYIAAHLPEARRGMRWRQIQNVITGEIKWVEKPQRGG